jgi:hypothetical protein
MDALGGVIPASNCTLAPYKRVALAAEPASAAERAVAKELGGGVSLLAHACCFVSNVWRREHRADRSTAALLLAPP